MVGCGAVTEVKSGPGLYKADHSTLLGVTCINPHMSRSFAKRHGVPRIFDTADALLADPEIDVVYIATPPVWHKPLALKAARAGKHVYVEKPMAMRFTECEEIIDECERQRVKLYVAHYRRAMPRFTQVKKWLEDNAIGDLLCVNITHHLPAAPEDLSPTTLPWRLLPDVAGGGKFLDMGVHALDIFDFWFGPVVEVHGIAANFGRLYDVEDTVTASWRHASGVQGCGSWCYVSGEQRDQVEVIGSKGRIEMEFFSDRPLRLTTKRGTKEISIVNPPHVQQPFIQSIVDDLNGVSRCPGDPDGAARASWVADQILAGYRRQKSAGGRA
jgi:predicted dehydrogenase